MLLFDNKIIYMYNSSELIQLPQNYNFNTSSNMRGSAIRNVHKKMQPTQSAQLSRPIVSNKSNKNVNLDSLEVVQAQTLNKQGMQMYQLHKSNLLELNFQKEHKLLKQHPRSATPNAAKQYVQSSPKPQRITIQNNQKNNQDKLKKCNFTDLQTLEGFDNRLSLSRFHEKIKSIGVTIEGKAKTSQTVLNLKLEGQIVKFTTTDKKQIKASSKAIKKQQSKNKTQIYITQQKQMRIFKNNQHQDKYQQVLTKLPIQEAYLQTKKKQKNVNQNKIKIHQGRHTSLSHRQLQRKISETPRQSAKVNIINIVEQDQIQFINSKIRPSYSQFCTKHLFHTQYTIESPNKAITPKRKHHQLFTKQELVEELRSIERQINTITRHNQTKNQFNPNNYKWITNQQEEKLKQRKFIMKNYTFKSPPAESKGELHSPDDFYVQGWNNSQYEKKQILIV